MVDEDTSVSTWDALQRLGFAPDDSVDSDVRPGLSFDFGKFSLAAGQMFNLHMRWVVSFSGLVSTPNALASIEFEMPGKVESDEQCAAWIAWHLKEQLPARGRFIPRSKAKLLVFGLQHQATLPWERNMAEYAARPRCLVERSWLRHALKDLAWKLNCENAESLVEFSFDGRILSFHRPNWVVPVPGAGAEWPLVYHIRAGNLARLPSRLMREQIEISVWNGSLTLGNRCYCGAIAGGDLPDHERS